MAGRQLVSTRKLAEAEVDRLRPQIDAQAGWLTHRAFAVFEHERVSFPSFPYEWPPEMLAAAGQLTLDLAEGSLAESFGLKDATPYNVLFRGAKPVFIDLLSFERRTGGDPVWKPYGQFVRTFLLPLLAHRLWRISLGDIFLTHRDGLEPEEVYHRCGPVRKVLPPVLTLVSLPTWLAGRGRASGATLYRDLALKDKDQASYILQSVFRRLRRMLKRLQPAEGRSSRWSDYMRAKNYSGEGFATKEQFVEAVLEQTKPRRVLDVGANTGHFSVLAAQRGAEVVAIDSDAACVGALWHRAHQERLNILPLVVDLARPSPNVGWRNRECPAFLDRARGGFDLVFMLAVLHHLLVTDRVPLGEVLDVAASLTTDALVIEFVSPEDEMFRQLTRGRDYLFQGLGAALFECACREHFEIVRSAAVPHTQRRLYFLRKVHRGP
jgi:SAM-dependent methyltransferase